jgi:hypothetical protein
MELVCPLLTTGDWETIEDHLNVIFDLWFSYFIQIAVFRPRQAIRSVCVHRTLCHLNWTICQLNREDRNPAKILEDLQNINDYFIAN